MVNLALRVLILGALFWIAAPVSAGEYGPYICRHCILGDPAGTRMGGDTYLFIGEIVNNDDDGKWETDDLVTVCNGTVCTTYQYRFGGWNALGTSPDQGGPYENTNQGGLADGGVGGAIWGIVGYQPVYIWTTVCGGGTCWRQKVLVAYEPIYGWTRQIA